MHDRRAKLFSIVTAALNDPPTRGEIAGSFEADLPIVTLTTVKVLSGSGEAGKAGGAENGKEDMDRQFDGHCSLDVSERGLGRG
jgi:hypothetical protein